MMLVNAFQTLRYICKKNESIAHHKRESLMPVPAICNGAHVVWPRVQDPFHAYNRINTPMNIFLVY